jgi:hypothetical protein
MARLLTSQGTASDQPAQRFRPAETPLRRATRVMVMTNTRSVRPGFVALLVIVTVAFLTGCTGGHAPTATSSAAPAPANSLGMTCSELVTPPVVAALHPGLKAQPTFKPMPATYPGQIKALGGLSCGWQTTDGLTLAVAVVKLSPAALAAKESKVSASSTATVAFGDSAEVRGYVAHTGGTSSGDIEVFTTSGYWVSAVSPLFVSASDAEAVIAGVLQAVPSG